jgi:hypothetical protein
VISAKAVKILLQISTSYLREQAISCPTNIKSKDRNHLLSFEEELRFCQKFGKELNMCAKKKQAQVSHYKQTLR